jgi:hypothetical protein
VDYAKEVVVGFDIGLRGVSGCELHEDGLVMG